MASRNLAGRAGLKHPYAQLASPDNFRVDSEFPMLRMSRLAGFLFSDFGSTFPVVSGS